MTISDNPWNVESLRDFAFLLCPECDFKSHKFPIFKEHALNFHPLSFDIFTTSTIEVVDDAADLYTELQKLDNDQHYSDQADYDPDFEIMDHGDISDIADASEDVEMPEEESKEVAEKIRIKSEVQDLESQAKYGTKKYCCPQCAQQFIEVNPFQIHALERHPQSLDFFVGSQSSENTGRNYSLMSNKNFDFGRF